MTGDWTLAMWRLSHCESTLELGSDKVVVRLGGIYALEGVMNTSEQYHKRVLEVLCAFVRDATKTDTGQTATDIQAAITVIGRRATGAGVVDLTGSHSFRMSIWSAPP